MTSVTQPTGRREILSDTEIQVRLDVKVEALNETFTHIVSHGRNYVVRVNTDALGHHFLEFFKLQEFRDMLTNQPKVLVGYSKTLEEKYKPLADVWLASQKKKECTTGITFYPVNKPYYRNKFNTYFGLGAAPIKEPNSNILKPYLEHIERIICNNDTTCYEYVLNWLAHLVQKPHEKPEVAIILKAGQGTGKGTFVEPIGKIIGAHYLHATKSEHVLGRFNVLLENKILIFADEFFAGSKKNTDFLKGLITEDTATIERKGIDSITVPSFSRLIMASNHDNIVKIEKDERRYLYLEVSEDHKQDFTYFKALKKTLSQPSFTGELLQFLLDRDITHFNPRQVPHTEALQAQKLDNLEPLEQWLYYALQTGDLINGQWPARESSVALTQHVETWLRERKLEVWGDTSRKLGRLLNKNGFRRVRQRNDGERTYLYETSTLEDSRILFSEYIKAELTYQ